MPKTPMLLQEVVLKNGGVIETEAGTNIISVSAAGVVTVTATDFEAVDLTLTGDTTIGNSAADTLTITATLAGKIPLALNGGAASASGLLMGVGTSGDPATTAAANNMFAEFRTESTATSGDSRGLYWRHSLNGAGVSGEAIRAFTKVDAAVATARGAHISLDLAADGTVSGFGAGVDAQVLYGDAAYTNTVTAVNAELYAAGSSSAIGAGTGSIFRVVVGGDATGVADILDNAAFISFANAAGSGDLVDSSITALTGKAGLRVYVAGALYGYIPIVTGS